MRVHAPKRITFWISLILVVLGLLLMFLGHFSWAWILILAGYILLALGVLLKGL